MANGAQGYLSREREKKSETYAQGLAAWACVLGAAAISLAIYASLHYSIGVPFQDQWTVIEEITRNHGFYPFPLLWAQHNEHRVPFVKILLIIDLYWFKGRNVTLYLELYAMQVIHFLFWVWALRRLARWPDWMVVMGAGLVVYALFWISQWESLLNPFAVSSLGAFVGGTIAVFALYLALDSSSKMPVWLAISIGAAFFAEAGLANGLLLWPLLVILAIRLRFRPIAIVVLGIAGVLCTAVYLYGYQHPPWHANPVESLGKPFLVVSYLLAYFGNCWSLFSPEMGKGLAAIGVVAAPFLYIRELRRSEPNRFALAMLTLCMYLLGTGFLTALGRLNFSLAQAGASRYQTPVLLFWLCLGFYAIDAAYRTKVRYAMFAAAAVLLLATAILTSYAASLDEAKTMAEQVAAAALPITAGVRDDKETAAVLAVPDKIMAGRKLLLDHKTAFFGYPAYQLFGQRLTERFLIAPPDRCFGEVDSARRITDPQLPGWALAGWAWDHQALRPLDRLIAVTDGKTISGIGISGFARGDVQKVIKEVSNPNIGWRVYIRGANDFPSVKVYGIVDDGKSVCLVKPAFAVPKT